MARLLSLNIGMPHDVPWQGRTVHTGIFKYPVEGARMVRTLNIDGDGQGDLNGHGGEIRAVLVYQRQSYDFWRRHLERDDLEYGQFGENFTVDGLPDDEVHIGDRYRIGEAEFEVTQPRVTCFRVGMRLGAPEMPALLVAHHRPGFYFRVIAEGHVQAGDEIIRTRVGRHRMSVATIDALLYLPDRDVGQLRKAVDIPALSPGWQGSFRDLLDAEHQTPADAEPDGWAGFRPLRVSRIVPESATVASIHLAAHDGAALPRPKPGQYLTLRVTGAAAPPPVRNYSLSAAPSETEYRISVKRETDGIVSTYLHTHLRAGDTVDVAAPRGDFILPEDGNDTTPILLLSAGVGITPVMAMLHTLAAARSKRDIWWLHTTRSAAEHAFAAEAHQLLKSLDRGHEYIYYTAASSPGRLNQETLTALDLPTAATTYLCGPGAFMTAMQDALVQIGLDPDRIHTELFGALPAINPGLTDVAVTLSHQPSGVAGAGPHITFIRSGLTVPWRDDYTTVLEFAEACDVPTRWSCRTGVCHTCQTEILSGTVRYRPDPLEPPAPGTALVCCSQPQTDLVLDL
jgi:ferredoxin-NADP reductase/MOSC domain-containing protein YiiM/ferredoxin